jgi:1-acyl-sn-glycerol-3-phosphate acyltransferase
MWVIRLVLTVIVLVLLLLIGLVMHVITWIVGRFDQAACLRMRSGYMRLALKLLWVFGGGKATVIGTENIPTDRAVLFVGNHRSIMDVVLAGHLIPVPVGFISKIELKKIPLLNLMMEDINCLFLDRKDDRQALKVILNHLKECGLCKGKVWISHCENSAAAEMLSEMIRQEMPQTTVQIHVCRGLCSYYAEKHGLLVGFEKF